MSSIEDQIAWEEEAVRRGSERYYANQQRLRDNGQGDRTDVMSYLVKERLQDTADLLKDQCTNGLASKQGKYDAILAEVSEGDYLKIAYLGLKSVLKAVQIPEKNTVLKVAVDISARIEADLKCRMFEAVNPAYYDTVRKSFASQNVTDYVHKHKVMMKKFNDFDLEWEDWTPQQKVQIGIRVIRVLLDVFGDVVFKYMHYSGGVKSVWKLDTTAEFDEWAEEFEKVRGLLLPMYLPMKVPPRPWTSTEDGGYYTTNLKMNLIKTKSKEHRQFVDQHTPHAHMEAINKLQRTAWAVNKKVLEVQEKIYELGLGIGMPSSKRVTPPPFPEHLSDIEKEDLTPTQQEEVKQWKKQAKMCYGSEQQRKGQIVAFMQSHKLAKEVAEFDKFYFVYTADFRGRIYCATAGLSPQGSDTAKGLLRFAKGVKLGKSGLKWLAIHGANTFGKDKLPYDERVTWIHSMEGMIRSIVNDPIGNRTMWGQADKPYQFLAFCYEWASCNFGRDPNVKGYLPVGLDGSCNGLQHFSAILRDEVGAQATNLTACELPADIYQEVANVTTAKLQEMNTPEARAWLKVGVTRKCAKRPVMTLPYGATKTSARLYILEYVQDNWGKFNMDSAEQWEMANYLTPILWEAIGEVVVAARAGMDWMQKQATTDYIKWVTPIGFPVFQYYKNVKSVKVKTQLDGEVQLFFKDLDRAGEPSRWEQKNGIAPNFIHSIDSTHMVMTINGTKLESYAMIHDDFGTHAGNAEYLHKCIPRAFLKLYANNEPLVSWANQVGADIASMPPKGSYNLMEILQAKYFFG